MENPKCNIFVRTVDIQIYLKNTDNAYSHHIQLF